MTLAQNCAEHVQGIVSALSLYNLIANGYGRSFCTFVGHCFQVWHLLKCFFEKAASQVCADHLAMKVFISRGNDKLSL